MARVLLLLLLLLSIVHSMLPNKRPPASQRRFVSKAVDQEIARVAGLLKDRELATLFNNCWPNTLDTTVEDAASGFVKTGDIDAMWLRDSTNQVKSYMAFATRDAHLQSLLKAVVQRQTQVSGAFLLLSCCCSSTARSA